MDLMTDEPTIMVCRGLGQYEPATPEELERIASEQSARPAPEAGFSLPAENAQPDPAESEAHQEAT